MTYTARNDTNAVVDDATGAIIGPEHEDEWAEYQAWVAAGNTPNPAPPPPVIVPIKISRRQFFQAAAKAGIITQAEAIAMLASGTMPAALAAAIALLPENKQFDATMAIVGDPDFYRADSFVIDLGAAMGETPAQIDGVFILGATL